MINQEENDKLVGKFIRSKSKLYDKVSIMEFDFEEIAVSHTTYTDNINGNIIHARYHEEHDISMASQVPDKFDAELLPPEAQAPLMVPIDFTEEWKEARFNNRKKSSSAFESESDALAEINRKFSDILGDNITADATNSSTEEPSESKNRNVESVEAIGGTVAEHNVTGDLNDLPTANQTPHVTNPELSQHQQDKIASQEASMDYLSKKNK